MGSSINLAKRLSQYFDYNHISGPSLNMLMYRALLKHGYSGFRLEILEYSSIEELIDREQFFIDSTNPEYNILKVAGSSAGFKYSETSKDLKSLLAQGRKLSPETLLKMSRVVSEEAKAKISAALKGIEVSPETTSAKLT